MAGIDLECEKAMIQFIFYHRAIRFADLDTVWKAFLKVYPFPAEDEIKAWDLKLHFLCMDLSSNLWDLDEEVFLYAKYPDLDEEEEPEIQRPKTTESSPNMLVTFERTQSYNTGPSWEAYQVFKDAFES